MTTLAAASRCRILGAVTRNLSQVTKRKVIFTFVDSMMKFENASVYFGKNTHYLQFVGVYRPIPLL